MTFPRGKYHSTNMQARQARNSTVNIQETCGRWHAKAFSLAGGPWGDSARHHGLYSKGPNSQMHSRGQLPEEDVQSTLNQLFAATGHCKWLGEGIVCLSSPGRDLPTQQSLRSGDPGNWHCFLWHDKTSELVPALSPNNGETGWANSLTQFPDCGSVHIVSYRRVLILPLRHVMLQTKATVLLSNNWPLANLTLFI